MEPDQMARHLGELLADPKTRPQAGLWNLPELWSALCALRIREAREAKARIVETEVTRMIADELDFARETRAFVLIEGREGIGKSAAARNWCAQHPGQALYVRLESSSDETTLYRSIARQIGTACSYGRKGVEMRVRIQDALQSGQIMLVLDESHFLWPQSDRSERSVPKRIDWLRTAIVDFGVPVALISTPQFFARQCDRFRKAGWNSLQIQRRITHEIALPEELSATDVIAVARQHFPKADAKSWKLIAAQALATVGYLTTITNLRKQVDFRASRRPGVTELDLIAEILNAGRGEEAPSKQVQLTPQKAALKAPLNRRSDSVSLVPATRGNSPASLIVQPQPSLV